MSDAARKIRRPRRLQCAPEPPGNCACRLLVTRGGCQITNERGIAVVAEAAHDDLANLGELIDSEERGRRGEPLRCGGGAS